MKAIPTLSERGMVTSPQLRLDRAFADAMVSEHSQDPLAVGHVTSLRWIVAEFGDSPSTLARELKDRLTQYFQRHFDTADVTVDIPDEVTDGTEVRYSLVFSIRVLEDNVSYDLLKTITAIKSDSTVLMEDDYG